MTCKSNIFELFTPPPAEARPLEVPRLITSSSLTNEKYVKEPPMLWLILIIMVSLQAEKVRDVAQSGLEYTSGGRGVAGSNPVIPTEIYNIYGSVG